MNTHRNNLGVLRLMLATLVIVGHAPEQIDGDQHREPFVTLFGTLSLGLVAVAGFFLISGYLISASMIRTVSVPRYLLRRVMRIWPGYLAACLVCSFIVGPVVGSHPLHQGWAPYLRMVALLGPVGSPDQLAGLPIRSLNGALWTIPFEFGCYLATILLFTSRLLLRRKAMLGLTLFVLIATIVSRHPLVRAYLDGLGHPGATIFVTGGPILLACYYMVGSAGFLYREEITAWLSPTKVAASASLAILGLFSPLFAPAGLAIFGGLLLFWAAFAADFGRLQRVNDTYDISYGTYLYGWPIAITILYFNRDITPALLAVATIPLAWIAGAGSWWMIERRTKDLFQPKRWAAVAGSSSVHPTPQRKAAR